MPIVKSYAVNQGDMFCIQHSTDSFTIIDCDLTDANSDRITADLRRLAAGKGITRFICTHPDEDHFGGIHFLDAAMPISNFYCVQNQATKAQDTDSFKHYRRLRDGDKAFYIQKGTRRKWLNNDDANRNSAGISILWPDLANPAFQTALENCQAGKDFNNTSAVVRYSINNGASFLWLGDLHTDFMEEIEKAIALPKTTVVFAPHHGRDSGRLPASWLKKLDPQIIVIGEAPSRHLNYYTGYRTLTQNSAGDITFSCDGTKVHVFVTSNTYQVDFLHNEHATMAGARYVGTLTLDEGYTLGAR